MEPEKFTILSNRTHSILFIVIVLFASLIHMAYAQTWTQITSNVPTTREFDSVIYDSTNNRMTIFGGVSGAGEMNDVWVLSNANGLGGTPTWLQLFPIGSKPTTRFGHSAVYDPTNNRMTIFGGFIGGNDGINDVWVLSNTSGIDSVTSTWTKLSPIGSTPTTRQGHTAVYDSTNNRMIIFGGLSYSGSLNDVWVLSHANGLGGTPLWAQITTIGNAPATRFFHTAIYDSINNRMTIFGGDGCCGNQLNDVWMLGNANGLGGTPYWTQLFPTSSTPNARGGHTVIYDNTNNRMTIFGGYGGGYKNDVWVLNGVNGLGGTPFWTQLFSTGSTPNPREGHTAVYDNTNNRMTIFGGGNGSYLNDVWVLDNANGKHTHPNCPNIPSLKLFIGQGLTDAFNLEDYNTGDTATTYSNISNFLNLNLLNGSTVNQLGYHSATSGMNIYISDNAYGEGTTANKVKYSTYKIKRLPQIVLRPNRSWNVIVGNYTIDSSNSLTLPPSFNNNDSLLVSDSTQLSAIWSDASTVTITTLSGFKSPQQVDVIASPQSTAPFGIDIDKERIEIYPALSTTAFEFNTSSDTGVFSYQLPAGVSNLANVSYVNSIPDTSGNLSNEGTLKITFSTPSSGIKITPQFNTWLPNTPQTWYTLRVRVFGTNTANTFLQLLYNGNPGKSPTDIQGYFKYSIPTTWSYFDIPVNSFSTVSSTPVMYPQLLLKAGGATGIVYIDEMEIFQATPPLISGRYMTNDKYVGGYWNDSSATSYWSIQKLLGTPSVGVSNGKLVLNTSGTSTSQTVVKYTASTSAGQVYTVKANIGQQVGVHMQTYFVSGTPSMTLTQAQVSLLGAKGPGSGILSGDIGAAAEFGRISPRTLRTAFFANSANYQVQFILKTAGTSTIQIDNTQADIDNDDPNYGDANLFP